MVSLLVALTLLATPDVKVVGALPRTGAIDQAALEKLGPTTVKWKEHGAEHTVTGVPLDKVIASFGFEPGPMGKDTPKSEKRKGWKMALVATAPDGFQAVFSCAELAEGMGPTRALLVWAQDGKPLGPELGPFRIAVLTDQEPSRSVHQVSQLEVVDLRKLDKTP